MTPSVYSLHYRYIRLWSTVALLITFCLSSSQQLSGQDRWVPLDPGFSSGFGTEFLWPRPGSEMFWLDSATGYYYTFEELNLASGLQYFRTLDAGATWEKLDSPVPLPHRIVEGSFAISPFGHVSEDGGDTWSSIVADYSDTNYFPDQDLRYTVTRSVAFDSESMVVLFQLHDFDASAGDSVPYGPFRLGFTRDGGTSWRFVDSILVFGDVLQELDSVTDFGPFPVPATMTNTITNGWWKVLGMPNDSVVHVLTKAYGTIDGSRTNVFFLGRLNLNSLSATWSQLPFTEPNFPPPAAELTVESLSDNVIWALQGRFADLINDPDSLEWKIWRTEDMGASWDTIDVPSDIDFRSLRFVNENVGVASNAVTLDGGRSWIYWTHPYERNGLFYPIDSTNYRHVNRFSFFATSEDAGQTWQHNDAGGLPLDVNAEHGRVLVGRTYGSLMLGFDQGSSFRDPGLDGEFPARTHRVWTAAYPDLAFDSNRIVAVATIIEYDGSDRTVVLESSDGGNVWSVGQELEEFGYPAWNLDLQFAVDPDAEVRDPVGFLYGPDGLYVTENDGVTWEHRNGDLRILDLTMVNTQYGVAVTTDGIYQTTDGGQTFTLSEAPSANQTTPLGSGFGGPATVGVMYTSGSGDAMNWSVEASDDFGATFSETNGGPAEREMNVGVFWGDSANIHTVSRYGIVQHSGDAGTSFDVEQDSSELFRAFVGYVDAGADTGSIYIAGPGNTAARFWMYWTRPASVQATGNGRTAELDLVTLGNPITDGRLRLVLKNGMRPETILLYDGIGRVVLDASALLETAGYRGTIDLDVSGLSGGRYTLEVRTENGLGVAPVIIVR